MADTPASPHQIVHVEIPSADQQTSCDFYSGLFGWETVMLPDMDYAGYNPGGEQTGVGFAKIDEVYQPGKVVVHVSTPDIEATLAKASGLGATSAHTWLKLPVVPEMERVLDSTTLPTLLLGGDPTNEPAQTYATWGRALACPPAVGLVVGRALLYPPGGDVAAAVDVAADLVHGGAR